MKNKGKESFLFPFLSHFLSRSFFKRMSIFSVAKLLASFTTRERFLKGLEPNLCHAVNKVANTLSLGLLGGNSPTIGCHLTPTVEPSKCNGLDPVSYITISVFAIFLWVACDAGHIPVSCLFNDNGGFFLFYLCGEMSWAGRKLYCPSSAHKLTHVQIHTHSPTRCIARAPSHPAAHTWCTPRTPPGSGSSSQDRHERSGLVPSARKDKATRGRACAFSSFIGPFLSYGAQTTSFSESCSSRVSFTLCYCVFPLSGVST